MVTVPDVTFVDFENKPIGVTNEDSSFTPYISNVKFVYEYGGALEAYGGYTSTDVLAKDDMLTVNLTRGSDNKTFTQSESENKEVRYAGVYTPKLVYEVNGRTEEKTAKDMGADAPTFTVWSKKPDVTITDITMDGGSAYAVDLIETSYICDTYSTRLVEDGCNSKIYYDFTINNKHVFAVNNTQYISRIEEGNRTAWIYFKCSHTKTVSSWTDSNLPTYVPHDYLYNNGTGVPAATLTISNMGNASNANLTFAKEGGGDVIMITQYTADRSGGTYWGDFASYGTSAFEWSGDGTCSRFIGVMDNNGGENDSDTKTVAGTIVASTLIMTDESGNEYSIKIPTITIHNPY